MEIRTDNSGKLIFPVRLQQSRRKGYRIAEASPNGYPNKVVSRGTRWGNMFRPQSTSHRDIQDCIIKHRAWLQDMDKDQLYGWLIDTIVGFNLVCWCPLNMPCHADLLLALANERMLKLDHERAIAVILEKRKAFSGADQR